MDKMMIYSSFSSSSILPIFKGNQRQQILPISYAPLYLHHVGLNTSQILKPPQCASLVTAPSPSVKTLEPVVSPTADYLDANEDLVTKGDIRILPPIFKIYGKRKTFSGRVVTVRIEDDSNFPAWDLFGSKSNGDGKVVVIDGGGSMRCAMVGEILLAMARERGWVGVIVYGCIRDVDDINSCDIGVRALSTHPKRARKERKGEKHVAVSIGGTEVRDGDWLYADGDGIIVSTTELSVEGYSFDAPLF